MLSCSKPESSLFLSCVIINFHANSFFVHFTVALVVQRYLTMGTVTDNIILPWQHRVCVQCLKQNPHAVWLVKYKCLERNKTHKGNTALVVIDHERMALTQIRPPPETFHHFRGRFYMCRHGSYCPSGDGCNFAHSRFELDNWNTLKTIVEGKHKYCYVYLYAFMNTNCSDCIYNVSCTRNVSI